MRDVVGVPFHDRGRSLFEDCPWLFEGLEQSIPFIRKPYLNNHNGPPEEGPFTEDGQPLFAKLIRELNKADPTGDKSRYTEWLVAQYNQELIRVSWRRRKKKTPTFDAYGDPIQYPNWQAEFAEWEKEFDFKFEDADIIRGQLARFEELRRTNRLGGVKITNLNYEELLDVLADHAPDVPVDMKLLDSPPNKVLHQDDDYALVDVRRHGCIAQFATTGSNPTNWCVADDSQWFRKYRPPFYLVLKTINGRYKPYALLHYGSFQFMSKNDNPLVPKKFKEVERYLDKKRFKSALTRMIKRAVNEEQDYAEAALETALNAYEAFPWVRKSKIWLENYAALPFGRWGVVAPFTALAEYAQQPPSTILDPDWWQPSLIEQIAKDRQLRSVMIKSFESEEVEELAELDSDILIYWAEIMKHKSLKIELAVRMAGSPDSTDTLQQSVKYAVRVIKKPLKYIDDYIANPPSSIDQSVLSAALTYARLPSRRNWKPIEALLLKHGNASTFVTYAELSGKRLPRKLERTFKARVAKIRPQAVAIRLLSNYERITGVDTEGWTIGLG